MAKAIDIILIDQIPEYSGQSIQARALSLTHLETSWKLEQIHFTEKAHW